MLGDHHSSIAPLFREGLYYYAPHIVWYAIA